MQNDFFNVVSVEDFLDLRREFSTITREELVWTESSCSRILSQDLYAPEDIPPYPRSCMDGYAVKARDLFGASESNPVYLQCIESIAVNTPPEKSLAPGQCSQLSTGSILPSGADSVIMMEYCETIGKEEIEIRSPLSPGENVMQSGEDCTANDLIFSSGRKIRPQEIGLLGALGITQVPVLKNPIVGVITTGDELVDIDTTPDPGKIRDINSYTLISWIDSLGCEYRHYGIVYDNKQKLNALIEKATRECDLLLVTGGSSVGARDITLTSFQELGEIYVHGVSLSPGKPTILANIDDVAVIGLPGQVTSSLVVAFALVGPFVRYISGEKDYRNNIFYHTKTAELDKNIFSKPGREDYIRVKLHADSRGNYLATPILGKSGLLYTLLDADGLLKIDSNLEGLKKGNKVEVFVF